MGIYPTQRPVMPASLRPPTDGNNTRRNKNLGVMTNRDKRQTWIICISFFIVVSFLMWFAITTSYNHSLNKDILKASNSSTLETGLKNK